MNPVEAVKERLDNGRKWQKYHLGLYQNPRASVCLVGAIRGLDLDGRCRSSVHGPILEVIIEQFPEGNFDSIPMFNDDPETNWLRVEMVLDKAAIKWEENHG